MSILRADSIRDRAGTGAPNFPNGATVTGVVTATSFSGAITGNVVGNVTGDVTGNVSGTSAGLTGTPSITVQDATVQGNLTVNGTTSTIDTVITAVDSLSVEGNVGIGTTNPIADLTITGTNGTNMEFQADLNSGLNRITNFNRLTSAYKDFRIDALSQQFYISGTERLGITSTGTAIFKGGLAEKVNVKSQLTGANACAITDGNVILTTTNEPGNTYPNITGVHSTLAVGEGFSVTIALKVNGSGTINSFQIDGVGPTINWSGGSAPSAGASGYDVFTFSCMKTGTGTSDYAVFGAATNYA